MFDEKDASASFFYCKNKDYLYNKYMDNKIDLKKYIESLKPADYRWIEYKNSDSFKMILKITSFLPDDVPMRQRIYCIKNDITKKPLCKHCEQVAVSYDYKGNGGYKSYCSPKCFSNSNEVKHKRKQTNLDKHGVANGHSTIVRDKIKATNIKRYGVEHHSQSDDVKNKTIETNLEKHGVENVFQSEEVKDKIKATNLEKYGTEYPTKNKNVKNKTIETNLERYGVNNPRQSKEVSEKILQTNLERYGGNSPFNSKEVRDKAKVTNVRLYGVDNPSQNEEIKLKKELSSYERYGTKTPLQSEEIKEQIKKTNLENYGVEYPSQSEEIKKKIRISNLEKYGVEHYMSSTITEQSYENLNDSDWLIEQHHTLKKSLTQIAKELDVSDCTVGNYLKKSKVKVNHYGGSTQEKEIVEFIKNNITTEIITNSKKIIPPREIDIFLPEFNLAIEFNGLYWHSELNGKLSQYHLSKTLECEKRGIRLIHIMSDEWKDQKQKCKDTILHFLGKSEKGVYARNTIIKEISWNEAKTFLELYHLLDAGTSGNYRIGAYDRNDELIGVMVFGNKNSEWSENQIELKRFVTNKKNNAGLGSKMFKYAIKQQNYKSVFAFVDRRWFTGLVKSHIGFEVVGYSVPTIWWSDGKKRFNRRFLSKKKMVRDFGFSIDMSKKNMLHKLGYYRIWDCGKIKLLWNNPTI